MQHALHTQEALDAYIAQVVRHRVLSPRREHALAWHFHQTHDPQAKSRLITANLRFVVKVAHGFAGYGLPLIDLIQEGNCGLTVAVEKFDPTRGTRLCTYAVWWIRAYIQNYITRAWSLVKMGTTQAQRKLFFRLRGAQAELAPPGDSGGHSGSPYDGICTSETRVKIAQHLGVSASEVESMGMRLAERDASLDQEVTVGSGVARIDLLASDARLQDEVVISRQRSAALQRALFALAPLLTAKEQAVVQMRMLAMEPPTLEQMGRRLNISRERVRQIETGIVAKLRHQMRASLAPMRPARALA